MSKNGVHKWFQLTYFTETAFLRMSKVITSGYDIKPSIIGTSVGIVCTYKIPSTGVLPKQFTILADEDGVVMKYNTTRLLKGVELALISVIESYYK